MGSAAAAVAADEGVGGSLLDVFCCCVLEGGGIDVCQWAFSASRAAMRSLRSEP